MRRVFFCLFCTAMLFAVRPALAETVMFEGQKLETVEATEERLGTGTARQKSLEAKGYQASIHYAPLADGASVTSPEKPAPQRVQSAQEPPSASVLPVLLVIAGFVLIVFLWMYFGTNLFRSRPDDAAKRSDVTPQGWKESQQDFAGKDPLADIAAMADRRAALVRMLRLCLLHAASVTGTRLKRSDTERAALARLPQTWEGIDAAKQLLGATELAHYGGRTVNEADFRDLVDAAGMILRRKGVGRV